MMKLLINNSSRYYLRKFLEKAAKGLTPETIVLDAGSGEGMYRSLFDQAKYESADFGKADKTYGNIDYVCDLKSIPVEDQRYDKVIFTQVLEHLPEPGKVLKELHRVLKKGGELYLSAPFYFEEHEIPYDFFRYTQYGLKFLLEDAGFKVENLSWLEGYFGTLAYQLKIAVKSIPLVPAGKWGFLLFPTLLFLKAIFLLSYLLFSFLDPVCKITKGHCKNYCVIAVKV